jgi:hypothetical protein
MRIQAGIYTIPLWVTCVFIMGSYSQVFHGAYVMLDRLLLRWVGGLIRGQDQVLDPKWIAGPVNLAVNLPLVGIFLYLYFKVAHPYVKVFFCFLAFLFLMCVFFTVIGDDAFGAFDVIEEAGFSIVAWAVICGVVGVKGMWKK